MEIVKVENGKVIVDTERGVRLRVIGTANDAVFADINPATGKILVTSSKGFVDLWNKDGIFFRKVYCSSPAAQMARWVGDDVMIQLSNGKTSIYRETGCWLRNI